MVERVKFLQIDVDYKTYNRIVRVTTRNDGGTSDLIISIDFRKQLFEPNEFLRLRCGEHYADLKISKFEEESKTIVVHFGTLIDHSKAVISPGKQSKKLFVKETAPKFVSNIKRELPPKVEKKKKKFLHRVFTQLQITFNPKTNDEQNEN